MEKVQKFLEENALSIFSLLIMAGIVVLVVSRGPVKRQAAPVATEKPAASQNLEPNIEAWPFLGNPGAKVVFVEYGDYQCGYCGRFNQETLPELKKKYIDTGKMKFVYKDFIIFGDLSKQVAQAAHCAGDQNKFFEYHDLAFAKQAEGFSLDALKKFAQDLGLDKDEFNQCLDSGKYASKVDQSSLESLGFGIEGTPTSIINGQMVVGAVPFSSFETVIDSLLLAE
jgi:protein-disulfide isomerase